MRGWERRKGLGWTRQRGLQLKERAFQTKHGVIDTWRGPNVPFYSFSLFQILFQLIDIEKELLLCIKSISSGCFLSYRALLRTNPSAPTLPILFTSQPFKQSPNPTSFALTSAPGFKS